MNPSDSTFHLLCAALRPVRDGAAWARLRGADAEAWPPVVDLAVQHGLVPVLYVAVKGQAADLGIPPDGLERMNEIYLTAVACHLRLFRALTGVLAAYEQQAIPAALLKGAHLASEIYPAPGLRTMGDVDLLLHERDLPRAERCLLDMGAEPNDACRIVTDGTQHFGYAFRDSGLVVENHWTLKAAVRQQIDLEALWARTREATRFPGARLLGPDDLLLHVCLHAAHDLHGLLLRAIYDATLVVDREAGALDWPGLCARAREWRVSRAVTGILRIARDGLGAEVPDAALAMLDPDDAATDRVEAMKRLLMDGSAGAARARNADVTGSVAQLWAQPGGWAKVRFAWRRLMSTPREMQRMYNAPAGAWGRLGYYPRRIADLFRRHGQAAWRMLRRDPQARALAARKQEAARLQQWLFEKREEGEG